MGEIMEISVARALVEVKTLDKRIEDGIGRLNPVAIKVGGKLYRQTVKTEEEFSANAKKDIQSLADLTELRYKLKGAIIISNATTIITICKKETTVAQAIEYKKSIELKKLRHSKLVSSLQKTNVEISRMNEASAVQMHKSAEAVLAKGTQKDSAEYKSFCETFIKNQEAVLVDPIDIIKEMTILGDEITEWEKEIDICLTESNARTMIKIDD
jgi:hypothetical protein